MFKKILLLSLTTLVSCSKQVAPEAPATTPELIDQSKYEPLEIDACDMTSTRKPNVKVDIGFGDKVYWAYTNEYAQLVYVTANEIVLQDEENEPVNEDGRYCDRQAAVAGTESRTLDSGHVLADSLSGVSNAYNITPQNSTLNRHGSQAYMEDQIRKALNAGLRVTDFEAIITYPNTKTMIPSHYKYTYTIDGMTIIDEFDNVDPETTIPEEQASTPLAEVAYVLNTNSKKIHRPDCESVEKISEANRLGTNESLSDLLEQGYEPCKVCNPE